MGGKHFTEEQIAFALRQHESGTAVAEIIRKLGISEQTFYRWKKNYAGLAVPEPSSIALSALGLIGVVLWGRRRTQ